MNREVISEAMQRVRSVFMRRPAAAIHANEPAIARLDEGLRVSAYDSHGMRIATDMPAELGGGGELVTPGWLLRAGLASCLATRVAMEAATAGITLSKLQVTTTSTSDARGLLGMKGDRGEAIFPGLSEVKLEVQISAAGVSHERLQALIDESARCSPVNAALEQATPIAVHVCFDGD